PTSIYKVVEDLITWYEGKDRCEAMGCILAEPKSEQEFNAIKAVLPPGWFWIGITEQNHKERYTYYTDDQDIVYNSVVVTTASENYNCVDMYSDNFVWYAYGCDAQDDGAICE
ncbi:lymphocyte antigen 75-like, partial [Saccoglossus kowalevskii]|uniref:Uncharacterized protein LOC102803903 n=1 Tax=Saccoglossus kowalevskii TaxID=10224 RepID=A0ABM0MT27_SACKO